MKINFKSKGFIFIISLFFAIVLWAFVMADSNTTRIADIRNINITFRGESDLSNKGLIVTQKSKEQATIRVEGKINVINYITKDNISAYVDLTNIKEPGEYKLPVQAFYSGGAVIKGSNPSEVTVTVERYVEKKVPVEVVLAGDMPKDYYIESPSADKDYVTVFGGSTNVQAIAKAIAYVDTDVVINSYKQTGHSEYRASMPITYVDENGNEVKMEDDQSTIVSMMVYDKKTVPVIVSVIDTPQSGYSVTSIQKSVESIAIYGLKSDLDKVNEVYTNDVSVAAAKGSVSATVGLKPIENIKFIYEGTVKVDVTIIGSGE